MQERCGKRCQQAAPVVVGGAIKPPRQLIKRCAGASFPDLLRHVPVHLSFSCHEGAETARDGGSLRNFGVTFIRASKPFIRRVIFFR